MDTEIIGGGFPLAKRLLACVEDERSNLKAIAVDQLDRERRASGIPSVFGPFKAHTGKWFEVSYGATAFFWGTK